MLNLAKTREFSSMSFGPPLWFSCAACRFCGMITPFGNAQRTGEYSGAAVPVTPETAWTFRCDAELTGSPAWDGDLVVVLDVDGGVHGLDAATGERRWSHHNDWGPASASGSAVITPTGVLHLHEEEIIELDRHTGEAVRVWDQAGGYITALDNILLVDGTHAVDLATRTTLWESQVVASLLAPPAVHDGIVVVTDGFEGHRVHGGVHAFPKGTGEPLWSIGDRQNAECAAPAQTDGDSTGDWEIPGLTHPIIADGRVWFTRLRRHDDGVYPHPQPWDGVDFVGCDLETGAEEWTWVPFAGRHHFEPLKAPAYTNGLLLCITATAAFDAADGSHLDAEPEEILLTALNTRTPESAWRSPLPGFPVGSPVIAGGVVYLLIHDGTVIALEVATGRTRWTHRCGEPVGALPDEDAQMFEEEPARLIPGDGSLLVQTAGTVRLLR
ncbi:PQQ-binding-like beta-propeller repeat protein [Streptomyces sp. NPDC056835]|uniref:outer membrane protein assembly factor BamB family protein n=1 Tax=Streptomyces sp. NPDC056835 TaxID=3345956 RepID=UPI0036ABC304